MSTLAYMPHQIEKSDIAIKTLRQKGICLLAGLPRTGKTATAIRVAEQSNLQRILVVTKKSAISGWHSELTRICNTVKKYTVTNYEQVKKLKDDFDMAIIDESHAIGRPGKPTQRLKDLRAKVYQLPILLLTGTPASESHLAYYYQFCLSPMSPFKDCKNFYAFFRKWGIPQAIYVNGRSVETYKQCDPELINYLQPWIVTLDQNEAGIRYQAQDEVHIVNLNQSTLNMIETIRKDKVIEIDGIMYGFDSDIAERVAVHQIETGALKLHEDYVELNNNEVINYLKQTFGDSDDVGFMCHFKATREKLRKHFKHAQLYSSNAHAEGVNLSHLTHFVIVNSDYSGAKFIQRRERATNINRNTPVIVHHIVTNGGISNAVYGALSNKKDFTLALYRSLPLERTNITKTNS